MSTAPTGTTDEQAPPTIVGLLRSPWLRLGALGVFVALTVWYLIVYGVPSEASVQHWVHATGLLAPIVFVFIYALGIILMIPATPFTIMAGLIFGVIGGIIVSVCGLVIGGTATFAIGRLLGRDAVSRLIGSKIHRFDGFLSRQGLSAVLYLRLVPVLPFTVVNYAVGCTRIKLRDYVVGTAIGVLPTTLVYSAFGRTITNPTSWKFWVSVGALLLVGLVGYLLSRRSMRASRAQLTTEVEIPSTSETTVAHPAPTTSSKPAARNI